MARPCQTRVPHADKAWEFFKSIGSPKYHVAPMVDQSELAFRMLCRRGGSTAAYTPMLHSRLFMEDNKYRQEHFTTCAEDRPLFVQFCANDPDTLLAAAKIVEPHCDAVDINFGCPQRIARRGRYGAFLMDDLELVERLVSTLAEGLSIPVTCKIRVFPELQRTIEYAQMIERAGCYLLAVHGRTREQKNAKEIRANWDFIKSVKDSLSIPVLANGNIRHIHDAIECMEYTGADGVMSADSLLVDPYLFSTTRLIKGQEFTVMDGLTHMLDYIELAKEYPTPFRMVKGHAFKFLGPWLEEHTDLRDTLNSDMKLGLEGLEKLTREIQKRQQDSGRDYPIPKLSARKLARLEREAALAGAIAEQRREEEALAGLEQHHGKNSTMESRTTPGQVAVSSG